MPEIGRIKINIINSSISTSFNGTNRVKAMGAAGLNISRRITTTITQKTQ